MGGGPVGCLNLERGAEVFLMIIERAHGRRILGGYHRHQDFEFKLLLALTLGKYAPTAPEKWVVGYV